MQIIFWGWEQKRSKSYNTHSLLSDLQSRFKPFTCVFSWHRYARLFLWLWSTTNLQYLLPLTDFYYNFFTIYSNENITNYVPLTFCDLVWCHNDARIYWCAGETLFQFTSSDKTSLALILQQHLLLTNTETFFLTRPVVALQRIFQKSSRLLYTEIKQIFEVEGTLSLTKLV